MKTAGAGLPLSVRMPAGEQPPLPAETVQQLRELARLADVPLDARATAIVVEMLNQHVTPTGILKLLERLPSPPGRAEREARR